MKKRSPLVLLVILVMLMVTAGVSAKAKTTFVAPLTGDAEVATVPVETQAFGKAIFRVVDDGAAIEYKLIVANLEDLTQAHIHLAPAGSNGPVVVFLYGFQLIPGTSNGIVATGTITQANLIARPAIGFGGTMEELLMAIESGNAYVNVHTLRYPAGEIRGQIR